MSKARICDIAECDNQLSANSQLTTCNNCRHAFSYWKRRRPAQMLERRRNLTKYADRMDTIMDTSHKITVLPRRKHG